MKFGDAIKIPGCYNNFFSCFMESLMLKTTLIIAALLVASIEGAEGDTMTNYTVVEKPEMLLVGIECRTSNAPGAAMNDIPALWGRFYGENIMSKIDNRMSDEVIALYCDYEGDYTQPYSLVIGCAVSTVDQIPEGFVAKHVPGGTYAAYRAIGEHPKTLIETWGQIWQTDLPRTYTGDYEVYGKKFISGSPQEVEVFIAIDD
jgi:predicted transcriptional regulator YdeE